MTTVEAKLKERVKELTCLYEVTSIIVNSDYDKLETSFNDIVYCLKRGWQFEVDTEVCLKTDDYQVQTKNYSSNSVKIATKIRLFNKTVGHIYVAYPKDKYTIHDFLEEEQALLNNIGLAVGSLLERKKIRDREAATRRQMARADRLHILGEITAGIAHELNTPLANILGFSELLSESIEDKDALRDLQKIKDNTIFSREIVKKLLFFACEMPQEMKPIAIKPIIESVLKLLGPSLCAKKIRLINTFSNDVIKLRADTIQLTQVLFNLVMNAIYFSPISGAINVNVVEKENKVSIEIIDQGIGVLPVDEDKIFEPFFTTKPIGDGSGLGLSVVHGIITSHKATIAHKPNIPKGIIFTIEFPKL